MKTVFPASIWDAIVSFARRSPGGGSKDSVIRGAFGTGPAGTSDTIVLDLGLALGLKPLSVGVHDFRLEGMEGMDGGMEP